MPLGTEVGMYRQSEKKLLNSNIPALRERGTAATPFFSAHVYCGHGRPSQLLLSFCSNFLLLVLAAV